MVLRAMAMAMAGRDVGVQGGREACGRATQKWLMLWGEFSSAQPSTRSAVCLGVV